MPFIKCPLCGSHTHLYVRDRQQWYRDRYPGFPIDSLVPGLCLHCWKELKIGDEVEVRSGNPHTKAALYGKRGQLTEVRQTAEHGALYMVSINGQDEVFIRAELKKPDLSQPVKQVGEGSGS